MRMAEIEVLLRYMLPLRPELEADLNKHLQEVLETLGLLSSLPAKIPDAVRSLLFCAGLIDEVSHTLYSLWDGPYALTKRGRTTYADLVKGNYVEKKELI